MSMTLRKALVGLAVGAAAAGATVGLANAASSSSSTTTPSNTTRQETKHRHCPHHGENRSNGSDRDIETTV